MYDCGWFIFLKLVLNLVGRIFLLLYIVLMRLFLVLLFDRKMINVLLNMFSFFKLWSRCLMCWLRFLIIVV